MTSTASPVGALEMPLEQVRVPDNVRPLDEQHVDALAGSIALRGQLVPAIVRPDGERFVLVAGFHRYAALKKLGRDRISVEVRDAEGEQTDRAVENIARKQLNPHEPGAIAPDATFGTPRDAMTPGVRGGMVSSGLVECAVAFSCTGGLSVGPVRIRCNIVAVSSDLVLACG